MRCSKILMLLVMGLTASVGHASHGGSHTPSDWMKLNAVNEPPNQPSKAAASVATQHMTKAQIKTKHMRLVLLYRQASAHGNGTALQMLKREILLLQLAGAE